MRRFFADSKRHLFVSGQDPSVFLQMALVHSLGGLSNILLYVCVYIYMGFPGGSEGKASACNAGDPASIPGSGRSPGEGNGNPLQDSCLENPMDGGA